VAPVAGGGWCVVCGVWRVVVCGVWCVEGGGGCVWYGIVGAEWFKFVYPGSQIESSSLSLDTTRYVVPRLPR